tara:strand:+ start:5710 stop:5958 length:249 start_codon:yes stop_codon:yes gene_type:complete
MVSVSELDILGHHFLPHLVLKMFLDARQQMVLPLFSALGLLTPKPHLSAILIRQGVPAPNSPPLRSMRIHILGHRSWSLHAR